MFYRDTAWILQGCYGVRVDRRLAPRVYEGGATSSQTGGGGSTNFQKQSVKQNFFCICRPYSSFFFEKDILVTNSPRYQCALLFPPPSQVRGARTCTASARTPLDKQLRKFPFSCLPVKRRKFFSYFRRMRNTTG